jgi:two-component system, chemotaxis family, chemotaxis protein CheY
MAKILVLDDSNTMRKMLTAVLVDDGHQVKELEDGRVALDFLKKNKTDLIVTDINMPKMSGTDFVREVRQINEYKFTPILAVTTECTTEKKKEGKEAGISGWVVKPFNPEKLIKAIKVLIGN